jgi:hypothetical protein
MVVFNFDKKESGDFPLIPAGIYDAVIERIEEKTASSGNKYKRITFRIFGEKAEREKVNGRLVWDNIVLLKQVEWKIQNLLYACGLPYEGEVKLSDDWEELLNKELKISVVVRDFRGTKRNEVKSFYPATTKVISQRTDTNEENESDDDIPIIEDEEEINPEDIPF